MNKTIMFAIAALLSSGSAMAIDNYSGVSTSLTAMAYDNQDTNANLLSSNINPTPGVYAGFSGTHAGVASSNMVGTAANIPVATTNGTYNATGVIADPALSNGLGGFASIVPTGSADASVYLYADNLVSAVSQVNANGYTAETVTGNNQLVTIIGNGVQVGEVTGQVNASSTAGIVDPNIADNGATSVGALSGMSLVNLALPNIAVPNYTGR